MGFLNMEKKWVFRLVMSSLVAIFLFGTSVNIGIITSAPFSIIPWHVTTNQTSPIFVESKVEPRPPPPPSGTEVPRFAYLISGSGGDLEQLWRTLQTLYHPLNHYVVYLGPEAPPALETLELASRVEKDPVFAKVGNVYMMTKADRILFSLSLLPTMIANTLHACAILLKRSKEWDWFINLSASDYPLVTQDDILFSFIGVKRDMNFIQHTNLDWKQANPFVPSPFTFFTGSSRMILSRSFVEFCVWDWNRLPRTLLMHYYSNFAYSPEGYFQTVACNVPEIVPTIINQDMHYISWDSPPKHYISWDSPLEKHPHILSLNDTRKMIESGAAFARKFRQDDPVLDLIDKELLGRNNGSFTPGGWCSGNPPCSKVGNPTRLKPGAGAQRLRHLIASLISSTKYSQNQCK